MKNNPSIGFISSPGWFDPSPAEFPEVCFEKVRTQQTFLPLPDFDYQLASIAQTQNELNLSAKCLADAGCDLLVQVGSPFAWAQVPSEEEARTRNQKMEDQAGIPCLMTSLVIIDNLRELGVKTIAVDCTYYEAAWRNNFAAFLKLCGFNVLHISNLVDQGLIEKFPTLNERDWSITPEMTSQSILNVAHQTPNAQAIVITGTGIRTLTILASLEKAIGKPIVAADTILYYAIARQLGLTLKPIMGSFATKTYASSYAGIT